MTELAGTLTLLIKTVSRSLKFRLNENSAKTWMRSLICRRTVARNAIASVSGRLRKFGGHRAAAGLTIDGAEVPAFRAEFVARVQGDPGLGALAAELYYDDELSAEELDQGLWDEVERFSPFGNANPEPLFRMPHAKVDSARLIGKNHLKMRVRGARGISREAIAWKQGELVPSLYPGREIDLCVNLDKNEFSGVESLELRVKDLRPL